MATTDQPSRPGSSRQKVSAAVKQRARSVRSATDAFTAPIQPPGGAGRRFALPAGRGLPWLLTGLLCLGGIALLAWGFGLRSERDAARAALASERQELAEVRTAANATAYTLAPTPTGPELARGTAFITPDGAGVLDVSNLPRVDAGRAYQIWYFPEGDAPPLPGELLALAADGGAFARIPADAGPFRALGLSVEPAAGSPAPTTDLLLLGTTGGARG